MRAQAGRLYLPSTPAPPCGTGEVDHQVASRCMHTARDSMARRVFVMEYAPHGLRDAGTSRSHTERVASRSSRRQRPFPHVITMSASTWSHAIDDGESDLLRLRPDHNMAGNRPARLQHQALKRGARLVASKIARIRARDDGKKYIHRGLPAICDSIRLQNGALGQIDAHAGHHISRGKARVPIGHHQQAVGILQGAQQR